MKRQDPILRFDLKAMLDEYESRTGLRPSYSELSKLTKIAPDTLKSIASRKHYNTTLDTLEALGAKLGVDPRKFLTWGEADSGEETQK